MVPSKDQTATLIREAFVKVIEPKVKLEDKLTARWVKAGQTTGGEYKVLQELQAAIAKIVEYLESKAGKNFLKTKTDIDNPNKIANLFDDAVAGVNALIDSLSGAGDLKKQIYTQLVETVAAQYHTAELTVDHVKQAAKKSEAALVTKLYENNKKVDCGGDGNCGPLSILGALNMASVAVSDPMLQKEINNFREGQHSAAVVLRKALIAYIKTQGNVDEQEKAALFMVPIGTPINLDIMTRSAGNVYFYKEQKYYDDLLEQSHWFTDAEMQLVAKMLNINIVVAVQGSGGTTIQRKETQDENPAGTIYLYNYAGAHYQAYPDKKQATIAPRTTKPLSDTREPEPERSPSPTLTLKQQTEAFALLVAGLKDTGMDDAKQKKLSQAVDDLLEKIGQELSSVSNSLQEKIKLIIDLINKEDSRSFLNGFHQAQTILKEIHIAELKSDSPIRVALQTLISSNFDLVVAGLQFVTKSHIAQTNSDDEVPEFLSKLYYFANDAASQFPVGKNTALMAAASALKYVYSVGEISDEKLGIPYNKGQHPDINRINAAQVALNNAILAREIKKDDPLFNIIQTAITCALQVVEKYNELHPDVAIKSTAATTQPKGVLSQPAPKKLNTNDLEKMDRSNRHAQTLLTGLRNKSAQNPENIKRTLEEAYDLAMLALQDERANFVFGAINLIFNKKGEIPNKTYVQFARKKIDALEPETDNPIKIALQTAVEAALVAIDAHEKLNTAVFAPPLTSRGSSSSSIILSHVDDENTNPGFVYLNPILDKTITPANNEKQAVAKMKDCYAMLEKLLSDKPHMRTEKIEELQTLFFNGFAGGISAAEFKQSFEEILAENIDADDPTGLLEGFKSREATIFNYVDIIAQSKLTSSLPILEQAFVIPKEMNNNSDLEKFEFLLDKFGATLEVIQETIKLEHPVFAMCSEEFCEQIEKFVKGDEDANDLEDIEGLFDEVLEKSDIPPALETILKANRCYITEALTRIQDSRDNAATLKSNDPKITNGVFEKFLDVYYGEVGSSKEFRAIKDSRDPIGPITLHNKTKGNAYDPKPLVTFVPSAKPAAPGVVPFADCKFSDIYAGAKAAFIVMSKFKAENPSAECSVDNPKLTSDADYKNFLEALYDATKSKDGKYMMNEVKINFTDPSIRQNFIEILSGRKDVGLPNNVVAALKDNFGPPKTFEYTGTRMPRPPRATKTVPLKTQGIFTDADYQPKPAATVTAPTTAVTSTRPTSSSL